jgi:hypothetical protein
MIDRDLPCAAGVFDRDLPCAAGVFDRDLPLSKERLRVKVKLHLVIIYLRVVLFQ